MISREDLTPPPACPLPRSHSFSDLTRALRALISSPPAAERFLAILAALGTATSCREPLHKMERGVRDDSNYGNPLLAKERVRGARVRY